MHERQLMPFRQRFMSHKPDTSCTSHYTKQAQTPKLPEAAAKMLQTRDAFRYGPLS